MEKYLTNVACIELNLNYNTKRIYFNDKQLQGKKINWIFLYSSTEDVVVLSPFSDKMIVQIHEIGEIKLSLSLTGKNNIQLIKGLDFSEMTFTTESKKFKYYKVNDELNYKLSFIDCSLPESKWTYKLLLYVGYETGYESTCENKTPEKSITYHVQVSKEIEDICLKDIVTDELIGKKITNIEFKSKHNTSAFLDIQGKDRRLENLPVTLFQSFIDKIIALNSVEIDFNKSFYRNRAFFTDMNDDIQLTFYYR